MNLDLKEKEEVVEIVKKSFLIVLPPLFKGLIFLSPAFYFLFFLDIAVLNIASFIWIIIIASYIFYHFLNWYLDYYLITNQRIIESTNHGFFSKKYIEMPLERIDNSKCEIKGILSTMFRFGSVVVFSISKASIVLEKIPEPRRIQNLISEVKEKFVKAT